MCHRMGEIQYEVTGNKRFSSGINWHSGICLESNGMPARQQKLKKVYVLRAKGLRQIPIAAVLAKMENYRIL